MPSSSYPLSVRPTLHQQNNQMLQNDPTSHVFQSLVQLHVSSSQAGLGPRAQAPRSSRIEGPSFPYFCKEVPKQFIMLLSY